MTYRAAAGGRFVPGTLLATQPERIKQDVDLLTVRVNYRFGRWPVVARY
jgi:hypothetical protein